jgi:hypothetical protein
MDMSINLMSSISFIKRKELKKNYNFLYTPTNWCIKRKNITLIKGVLVMLSYVKDAPLRKILTKQKSKKYCN